MIHPDRYADYYSPVLAGEAVPSVYHSLVEAAIRDAIAPERIMTAWGLRESLGGAVSLCGAILMLFELWWVGLGVMVFAVWATMKHTKPLNVRLGYCAVVGHELGTWGVRRGYLSLIRIPEERREFWLAKNNELLELAETDLHVPAGRAAVFLNIALSGLVFLGKLAIGVLLIISAWREPGWLSIGIGGVVGAFFLLQSLVRLPIMVRGTGVARRA